MIRQALILAGGKGTRLAEVLKGKPKCLVDVDGIPLLERQIGLLKAYGIDDVVVLVNHEAGQVERFLEERQHFGISVRLIDDGEPRGTAGAVLACLDQLAERFVVLYGDTLIAVDLGRFIAAHEASGAAATLYLHPNDHPADSDLVELDDDGFLLAFHPYPHDPARYYSNLVNAALYVIDKAALAPWRAFRTPSDFGKDLFPAMLAAGVRIKGYVSFEYIKDVGTPKRLAKAEAQLRSGLVERASLAHRQKAVFLDRDGTLNEHRGFISTLDELVVIPGSGEAVRRLNDAEFRTVLVTNQPVIARGEVTTRGLATLHAKLETELARAGGFLDAIYYCPHHPDGGYPGEIAELKIACDCRKPRTGMIDRAARELNIDLGESWMIGDTTRDIETARRAGLRSILVRTGEGGRDGRYAGVVPDFVADDIAGAVSLILERTR